jgi:hypothetical protein
MLVTEIAKEKLPRVARLHHSERSAFHRQRGDPEKLRIAAADLSVFGIKAHFDHALQLETKSINPKVDHESPHRLRWPAKSRALHHGRHRAQSNFPEETLEEPGFTTRACTQPDLVLSGLPHMTP